MRHEGLIIALWAALAIASAFGLANLQVSTDNRVFYGPGNTYFLDFLEFEATFTTNDNIIFVIHSENTVDQGDFPQAIRWLTQRAFTLSNVIRVDSLSNYPYPTLADDAISVESVLDWACPEEHGCIRPISEPIAVSHLYNRLISPDHRAAGVIATLSIERGAIGEIEYLHKQARELVADFEAIFSGFNLYFTGGVPMMAAFAEASADDLSLLLPLALLVIFGLLMLVLGNAVVASILLGMGVLACVIVLGIAGWFGHVINNATSISPVVIITLVVTSSMHVAVHFCNNSFHKMLTLAEAKAQAVASTQSSATPILISAATSAVSLATLLLVDSPPLRQLGILSAGGVIVGAALTLSLLPILLAHAPAIQRTPIGAMIQRVMNAYARRLEIRQSPAIWIGIGFLIASFGLFRLEIDDDFVRFFDESVEFRIQTDKTTEILAGPNHIEVVLAAAEGETVFSPEFLIYQENIAQHLRQEQIVANVHSFSDVMQHLSLIAYGGNISAKSSEEELSQLYLIYELSLQLGQSNTDLLSADQRKARTSVLLKETTSRDIQGLEKRLRSLHEQSNSRFEIMITGENIPVAHLSKLNIRSMLTGIGLALIFTAVLIGILFKSPRLGLVALLSTTIPVIAGFGIWGWASDSIGLAATAIIALTIGVVVDDTAHFLYRFLDSRSRLSLSPTQAAAYATHRVGTAIASTSVVLGAGLGLLMLSNFQVNSIFGTVTCLIIFLALIFDLAVLPRLAIWATDTKNLQS